MIKPNCVLSSPVNNIAHRPTSDADQGKDLGDKGGDRDRPGLQRSAVLTLVLGIYPNRMC